MKARLWVLVAVLLVGLLAVGLYMGWRKAKVEQRVEQIILKRMVALLGARVKIGDFHLGPGYVQLIEVTVEDQERGLTLTVDQARLSFSLLDHITGGFRSIAGLQEVLLSRPDLTVNVDRFLAEKGKGSRTLPPFYGALPERITVVKGSLTLASARGHRWGSLTEIDGWLQNLGDRQGSFRCTGSWGGGGAKNLLVSGTFHKSFQDFSLRAELREASLGPVLGSAFSERYEIAGGWMGFSVTVDKSPEVGEPQIRGRLELGADGLMDTELGVGLGELRARARLEGLDLVVEGIEAAVGKGAVKAQGRIAHLFQPTFQLQVEADGLEIARLLTKGFQGHREQLPRGDIDLRGQLVGSGHDLAFDGQLSAARLEVSGHRLADLRAHVNIQGPHVQVKSLKARLPWAVLRSRGELDMAPWPAALQADWRLEEVDLAKATRHLHLGAIRGKGVMAGQLSGSLGALQLRGGLRLTDLGGRWLPVGSLRGQFQWAGGQLSYRLETPAGRVLFRGTGTGWSRDSTHRATLQIHDMPVEKFLRGHGRRGGRLSGHWSFSGSSNRAMVEGEATLERMAGMVGWFDTWGEFSYRGKGQWCLQAAAVSRNWEVYGLPLSMKLHLSLDDQQLQLRELNLNDDLIMFGVMETSGQGRLSGKLRFSQLDARWLSRFFMPAGARNQWEGLISGRLELGGTWRNPRARGEVELTHGRLRGLGGLSLRLPLALSQGTFTLGPTFLRREGSLLMALNGDVNIGGSLALQVWGEQIPAETLARLLPGASPEVDGVLDYQCRIGGCTRSPIFEGQLRWVEGRLKSMTFDDFLVCLRGEGGRLALQRFFMVEKGRRKISAAGSIPYAFLGLPGGPGPEEGLDLSLQVEGDVLSLLPSFTSLVDEASGRGEAHFRLGGTPGSLVIGSGRLRFQGGWIKPKIFLEELKDFNGYLQINEGDRFVQIKELNGIVGNCPVEVVNFDHLELGGRQLEALQIPGLGLDLGILGLVTGEEGIEVNIPGLMAPEKMGRIRLAGTDLREPFILAGPLESPAVLGTLGLSHLDFTYPPYSSSEGAQLGFLKQVNWDLTVVALRDVWYESDLANLRVEDTQSVLHFTGSANDNTLRVVGHIEVDRGEVTYLDRQFQVVSLNLEFEGHERSSLQGYDNRPLVSGQFETTVYAEPTGVVTDVFLTIYAVDPETGERTLRGKWGDFKVELSSSDPSDDTQEKVLAKLGYRDDYADKALHLLQITLGPKLESHFIRPVLEPVERTIKRALGIDVIRLQPGLARNLLVQDNQPPGATESLSRRLLLPRSSLLIGKYLTDNCFLSYLGKFRTRTDELLDDRLGISHRFGLEFRLKGNTLLDLKYGYERDLTEGDKKVKITSDKRAQITHNFLF